jgi:hypothetical protein
MPPLSYSRVTRIVNAEFNQQEHGPMRLIESAQRHKALSAKDRSGPGHKRLSTGASRKPSPIGGINAKLGPIKGNGVTGQ